MSDKNLTLAEIYEQLNGHDVSDAREALRAESEYEHNIEDRGSRINRWAVYENGACVDDLLNKQKAFSLAKCLVKDQKKSNQEQ